MYGSARMGSSVLQNTPLTVSNPSSARPFTGSGNSARLPRPEAPLTYRRAIPAANARFQAASPRLASLSRASRQDPEARRGQQPQDGHHQEETRRAVGRARDERALASGRLVVWTQLPGHLCGVDPPGAVVRRIRDGKSVPRGSADRPSSSCATWPAFYRTPSLPRPRARPVDAGCGRLIESPELTSGERWPSAISRETPNAAAPIET